jgi:hypothetical protein
MNAASTGRLAEAVGRDAARARTIESWRSTLRDNGGSTEHIGTLYHQAPGYTGEWSRRLRATSTEGRNALLSRWMRSGLWPGLYTMLDRQGWYPPLKPFEFTLRPNQLLFDPRSSTHRRVYEQWLKASDPVRLREDPWQAPDSGHAAGGWASSSPKSFAKRLERYTRPPWQDQKVPVYERFYSDLGVAGILAPQGWSGAPQVVLLHPASIQDVK